MFKKGESGNPQGRPVGAKDKKSEKLRAWLLDMVEENRGSFAEDLAAVDPATRWNIIAKILPYVLPRLNAVAFQQDGGNTVQPLFIVHKNSGIEPASSEEEVLERMRKDAQERKRLSKHGLVISEKTLEAFNRIADEEGAPPPMVIECEDKMERDALLRMFKDERNAQ